MSLFSLQFHFPPLEVLLLQVKAGRAGKHYLGYCLIGRAIGREGEREGEQKGWRALIVLFTHFVRVVGSSPAFAVREKTKRLLMIIN